MKMLPESKIIIVSSNQLYYHNLCADSIKTEAPLQFEGKTVIMPMIEKESGKLL